jgi:hypothetical protein
MNVRKDKLGIKTHTCRLDNDLCISWCRSYIYPITHVDKPAGKLILIHKHSIHVQIQMSHEYPRMIIQWRVGLHTCKWEIGYVSVVISCAQVIQSQTHIEQKEASKICSSKNKSLFLSHCGYPCRPRLCIPAVATNHTAPNTSWHMTKAICPRVLLRPAWGPVIAIDKLVLPIILFVLDLINGTWDFYMCLLDQVVLCTGLPKWHIICWNNLFGFYLALQKFWCSPIINTLPKWWWIIY